MDHAHGVGAAPAPDEYHPYEEAENRWSIPRIVLAVASVAATVFFALTFIATGELLFLGLTLVAAAAAGVVFLWDEGRSAVHRVYHSVWGPPVPVIVPQVLPNSRGSFGGSFAPSAPPIHIVSGDARVPVGNHRPVGDRLHLSGDERTKVGDHGRL